MVRLVCTFVFVATSAMAQDEPMSGPDFQAYTKGRTLTFVLPDGRTHGIEQYLPRQRVLWSPEPGTCVEGHWYAQDGQICFVYESDPEPKCWVVSQTPRGMRADFVNTPGSTPIFEAIDAENPLICAGPDLLG